MRWCIKMTELKQLSKFCVETDKGKQIYKPSFLFGGDCRVCALLNMPCEDLEYPCAAIIDKCKLKQKIDCQECEHLEDCLQSKPCCWNCEHLFECLENQRDCGVDEYVKEVYGLTWNKFLTAIKMLKGVIK